MSGRFFIISALSHRSHAFANSDAAEIPGGAYTTTAIIPQGQTCGGFEQCYRWATRECPPKRFTEPRLHKRVFFFHFCHCWAQLKWQVCMHPWVLNFFFTSYDGNANVRISSWAYSGKGNWEGGYGLTERPPRTSGHTSTKTYALRHTRSLSQSSPRQNRLSEARLVRGDNGSGRRHQHWQSGAISARDRATVTDYRFVSC